MTAENWIKTFNARFNRVFDRLFDIQGFFLTKPRTSEALCMAPAALNSALLFPVAERAVTGDQSRAPPWGRSPAGARRLPRARAQRKRGPHPGNQGKHKHSRRGRNWKRYQVCGHGNMSPSPAPSTARGLQTLPRTGTAEGNEVLLFCNGDYSPPHC